MKRKVLAMILIFVLVLSLAACGKKEEPKQEDPKPAEEQQEEAEEPEETEEPEEPAAEAQGVTDDKILVGNTAATSGAFAAVGVPFNAGLEAALKVYNDAGGFNGKKVELVHYDDGFDAAQGLTYTKTLVEDDKVFALVGHFGTNTVGATLDYLKEKGVPMTYAATGISALYQEGATGKDACIFPVQPIFDAEGRVLLARAVAKGDVGLGGTKIGVIATTDDAGNGILTGIKRQAQEGTFDITYQEVDPAATDYTAALTIIKNAGCDVVIAAMNQAPFATVMTSMRDIDYNAKVITSYVSASATTLGELVAQGAITAERPVYTTAWLDVTTEKGLADYMEFAAAQLAWEAENGVAEADTYSVNSYAMAGYVAGKLFVHGLEQVAAQGMDLTWENYIAAMETAPFPVPMGGEIDYANGDRLGITALALNTIGLEADENGLYALVSVSPIMSLDEVWAAQ
ncbi:MAG: ABC transporter substrate-binding protein [Firmicutes bacterium]|nr:ABC transporter substrate-binding protein [Bacillota bacterium]